MKLFNKDDLPRARLDPPKPQEEEVIEPIEEIKQEPPKKKLPKPQPRQISNEDLLDAMRELYNYVNQRFDQIYYKIDQTQDLILKLIKN